MNLVPEKTFIPHPETGSAVRAVLVDIAPLRRDPPAASPPTFRLVFESECTDATGMRYCVWSRIYAPALHEHSALRRDLKKLLGRDFNPRELEGFDPETLINRGARLLIEHARSKKTGHLYARIALMRPDPIPLKPSGHYTRLKHRLGVRTPAIQTINNRQ